MYSLAVALAIAASSSSTGDLRVSSIVRASHHDLSAPLSEIAAVSDRPREQEIEEHEPLIWGELRPAGGTNLLLADPAAQLWLGSAAAPQTLRNFEGQGEGLSVPIIAPPDANGAVGLHHYVQVVNGGLAVFSKAGVLLLGPIELYTLWRGFNGLCEKQDTGDPVVVYDSRADRWLISREAWAASPADGRQCVAVSQTSDPTGQWYRYEFAIPNPDYTKIAVWPSAYLLSAIGQNRQYVCGLDRARMLAGEDATLQCFDPGSLLPVPADLDGKMDPPVGSPAYFFDSMPSLGPSQFPDDNTLGIYRLYLDWQAPANSRLTQRERIPIKPWSEDCGLGISQPGTSQVLGCLPGYLMNRVTYRNFGDHEAFLVSQAAVVQSVTGIRWYEVRVVQGAWAPYQQGTFVPDSDHRWMESLAMDRMGNIAAGYSVASASLYPSIRFTGRLAADPLGIMTLGEGTIYEGKVSQTNSARWGDYSAMQVDPVDDCTFWFTTEYAGQAGPGTRIASFRLPGCSAANTFSMDIDPHEQAIVAGAAVTFKLTTVVLSGTPENIELRADGFPAGVQVSFSAPHVRAGDSVTMTLTADAFAPAAVLKPFSVEGTSSSFQASNLGQVSISPAVTAAGVSVLLAPGSMTVSAGRSATVAVQTSVQSGVAGPIELSATGAPAGITISFEPSVVTAGRSSVLTISASPSAAAAATSCTVHARFGSVARELPLPLTILSAPAVFWVSPAAGSSLSGTAALVADADVSPGARLQSLQFFVDGISVGTGTTSPASLAWDTALASNGPHQLSASVVDSAGNTATTVPTAVMVHNQQGERVKAQGCGSTSISPLAALLSLAWLAGRRSAPPMT